MASASLRKEKPLPWLTQTGAWSAGPAVTCSKVMAAHVLHSLPFLKFATNEAIQRTEAYEYAQSLGAQPCSFPSFQVGGAPRLQLRRGWGGRAGGVGADKTTVVQGFYSKNVKNNEVFLEMFDL